MKFLVTKKVVCVAVLCILLQFSGVSIVSAQSAPLTATVAGSPDPTLPSPSPENSQLVLLRERYKTELSIYRTDEREFTIAKEQYNQVKTLASLEVAVQATRKVMISRITVLQTYLQIVELMVKDTPGIDVGEKTALLQQLTDTKARCKTHQQLVEQAIDRQLVLNAVVDFQSFSPQVTNAAYKSLSYISYGRLQSVYDKMTAVRDEVQADLEQREKNGLKLGEKRRAMDEINRNLENTNLKLQAARQTFQPDRLGRQVTFDADGYSSTVGSLSQIYADLFRNLTFLREVSKS
jgi:hypothetical protein